MSDPAPIVLEQMTETAHVSEVSPLTTGPAPKASPHTTRHTVVGKLRILRPPQREALEAFIANGCKGIGILPCGVGKTAVIMHALCYSNAFKGLIITANTQTAIQLKNDLVNNTDFNVDNIFLITGREKQSGFRRSVEAVVITTYTLFAANKEKKKKSMTTQELLSELCDTRCVAHGS
ncbi:MAG: hypothetical protein CMI16_05805 [Opitutaceae bacterium]|nr:hypothetical protein [Opitutaceae bacterium]|tara:strand:- start:520 stop:1053 length:534 start_codon:yes stop_codon:yes gene_type:complete